MWAHDIRVYGGSIDLGTFHIMGKDPTAENEEIGDVYGHLIQFGESDFLSKTHVYGSLGIAPAKNYTQGYVKGAGAMQSNYGNLFQTEGIVALGIYDTTGGDLASHQLVIGSNDMEGFARTNYYTGSIKFGAPGVGAGGSAQQSAFFVLDSRDNLDATGLKLRGHLWPLTFTDWNNCPYPGTGGTFEGAMVTVMDQFAGYSYDINEGGNGFAVNVEGANYFRIAPHGVEASIIYFTNTFKTEYQRPEKPTRLDPGKWIPGGEGYVGTLGLSPRAGGSSTTGAVAERCIGMQSWYETPIIFYSDENFAARTRGTTYINSGARGNSAGTIQQMLTDNSRSWGGTEINGWATAMFMMGGKQTCDDPSEDASAAARIGIATNHGSITLANRKFIDQGITSMAGTPAAGDPTGSGDTTTTIGYNQVWSALYLDYPGTGGKSKWSEVAETFKGSALWQRKYPVHIVNVDEGATAESGEQRELY